MSWRDIEHTCGECGKGFPVDWCPWCDTANRALTHNPGLTSCPVCPDCTPHRTQYGARMAKRDRARDRKESGGER